MTLKLALTKIDKLKEQVIVKENIVGQEKEKNLYLDTENKRLRHIIKLFQKEKFGTKSEEFTEENIQLQFNEIESEGAEVPQLPLLQETISYVRKKGRQKKKPFPETLPREEKIIDLSEADKYCPHDGTLLKEIGEDRVEKLITVPAQSKILIEIKKKYACPCCETYLIQAKTNPILPKTIATPELLSYLIFSKFFQSLPLYRMEELYKLQGIVLSRSTMARWLIQVSEQLQPIWNILEEKVLDSGYVAIDATTLQVLKEPGREAVKKSFMWVRGSPEQGIVLFDYDVSGGGYVAEKLLNGVHGAVQADAHKGYKKLDQNKIILLGCMMHARRRFYNAWVGGKKKTGLSEIGLKMIKRLYKFEESYTKNNFSTDQRYEARLKEVKPYLEKIKSWCIKKKPKVPPQSPIGNAIKYFINEYDELSRFLLNGRYEIDNGWVERVIRKFAIGRNNWMFSNSVHGADASALLYSLALTAKLNGKDPYVVFNEVLHKLPDARTISDYESLVELFIQ